MLSLCIVASLTERLVWHWNEHASKTPIIMSDEGAIRNDNRAAAVRNNLLVVLHDLSKRHTSVIDRHVPAMALAMYDESPLVRQQARAHAL